MNFIFIMSDSFRFDNLACYTKRRPRFQVPTGEIATPHLDAFAKKATIFDRAYVGSYPTVPNRKDLFLGSMLPFNTWSPLAKDEVTFVKRLGDLGYKTQLIQDAPHTMREGFNFCRDFDGWEWIRGQETDKLASHPVAEPGSPTKTRQNNAWGQHMANLALCREYEQDCFCAQTMTKGAQWLERNYDKGKFLLFLDTFDPHEPWDAPKWYEDQYNPGYKGMCYRYPIYGKASTYTKAELNHLKAMCAGESTLVDRWVGHLLETVERMGLMENTCLIFTADHGFLVGDHGWTGKNVPPMYEEIAHIPLLIHMPGQTKSRRVGALTQPIDLPATILDLAGVKKRGDLEGLSLRPALEGKPLKTRPYAFTRGGDKPLITGGDWSLMYQSASKAELFNLSKDPTQQKDLLKGNLARARRMHAAYAKWCASRGEGVQEVKCQRP